MAYGQNAPFGLRPLFSINGGSWTEKTNEYQIYADAAGTESYANPIFTGDPVVWGTSVGGALAADGLLGTVAVYNPAYTDATPSTFSTVPVLGVFMGCEYLSSNTSVNNLIKSQYWPGGAHVVPGSEIKAYVLDDPTVVYDIQVSTNINAAANAFVARPVFPNVNLTGGAPFALAGSFGRNFALSVGGGTNFSTVQIAGASAGYANNPATGSTTSGQSAFYLNASTSTAAGTGNNHDYAKSTTSLPLRAVGYTKNPNNIARVNPFGATTISLTPFTNVMVTINNPVYAIGSTPTVYVA